MMNFFRFAGDMCHVLSILVLLLRLRVTKNATVMKILYISSTAFIIYMVRGTEPFKTTYERAQDSFLHYQFAVVPALVLGIITNLIQGFDILELLWAFSIYLESVAIIPQLIVLRRYREVENLTGNYVFFLGAYRALYILNWIYRSYHEQYYQHNYVAYACGIIQTALYCDFFYYFIKSKYQGGRLSLPN